MEARNLDDENADTTWESERLDTIGNLLSDGLVKIFDEALLLRAERIDDPTDETEVVRAVFRLACETELGKFDTGTGSSMDVTPLTDSESDVAMLEPVLCENVETPLHNDIEETIMDSDISELKN